MIDHTESQQAVYDAEKLTRTSIGEVVDTNDPQQMGRVRVRCNYFGDNQKKINEIPFATPISPLSGSTSAIPRGRDGDRTVGEVAYGMFNVPKLGSYVLLGCVEGNADMRIYFGCIHDQHLLHTMPHGRYSYDTANDKLNKDEPSGPFSSSEDPIVPLYDSQTAAFTKSNSQTGQTVPPPRKNYEFRTRGADTGVSGVHETYINADRAGDTVTEDSIRTEFKEKDGNTVNFTQGYNVSEMQKGLKSSFTGDFVYDSQMYSWTTPGFHSMAMSDNPDNCRMRFRSTQGHQIIMDDTNERIYISTAGGKTWIEMDEAGNIDIYGERNISVHAEKDINFTAGGSFRVKAESIHLAAELDLRLHAAADINVKAGGTLFLNSGATTNILAGADIIQTGASIHLNGPGAAPAVDAYWTNRVPEHEPWARMMTGADKTDKDAGNSHSGAGEYPYDSPDIGRKERGDDLGRNPKWHR